TVFHYTRVLSVDTLKSEYEGRTVRYRMEVFDGNICEGSFEVTTLAEPSVRMIRKYRVPGQEYRFGVLSFRAIPYEMIYEVAVPLGWDPVDHKMFFAIEHHDESEPDFGSTVVYFTRSDSSWVGPTRVRWSHSPDDSLFNSEMKKLRRRLRPLEEESGPAIFQ